MILNNPSSRDNFLLLLLLTVMEPITEYELSGIDHEP